MYGFSSRSLLCACCRPRSCVEARGIGGGHRSSLRSRVDLRAVEGDVMGAWWSCGAVAVVAVVVLIVAAIILAVGVVVVVSYH